MQAIWIMHWKFLQASVFENIFLVLELVASNSKSEFPIWVGDLTINNAREQWEQWEPGLGAGRGHSVLRICPHWWTINKGLPFCVYSLFTYSQYILDDKYENIFIFTHVLFSTDSAAQSTWKERFYFNSIYNFPSYIILPDIQLEPTFKRWPLLSAYLSRPPSGIKEL